MSIYYRSILYAFLSLLVTGTRGQRGDVEPEVELRDGVGAGTATTAAAAAACSCSGSIIAAVIITAVIFLVLGTLLWYFQERKRRRLAKPADTEALSRAAYDNPHFQSDELDQQLEDQTRITIEPGPPQIRTNAKCTTTIATNTTNTLEREKTTLERVMAAIIRGSRSDSSKKTKDDSHLEPKDIIVPLRGHDFTGLGFTVHGNLKEGLYVKEVLNRGPASQSGQVISGDRIIALTILTDHIVFNDAQAILSYASPYPVLLHLKKKKPSSGSFSASSTLSSKGKLNQSSNSSGNLIHPAFRSQSHGDLSKISNVNINYLNMGNLMTSIGRSPGISQKVPKHQINKNEQRKTENRHSERAIDVPGVDVRTNSGSGVPGDDVKPNSVSVDIDGLNEDKVEIANVQVHRTMSSGIGIANQNASIQLPAFSDSNLSETTENLRNVEVEVDYCKPNPKTKFGVKVFPDITFIKGSNKIDLESGKNKVKLDNSEKEFPKYIHEHEVEEQNKENSKIELNIGVHAPGMKKDLSLQSSNDTKKMEQFTPKNDSCKDEGRNLKLDMHDINLPSLNITSVHTKSIHYENEAADNFRIKDKTDRTQKSLQGKSQAKSDKQLSDESIDTEVSFKEPKSSLHLKMPDINLPTVELTSSKTPDKEYEEIQLHQPNLKLPFDSKTEIDDASSSENIKKKSSFGFQIGMPDLDVSSLNSRERESDKHLDDDSKLKENIDIYLQETNKVLSSIGDKRTELNIEHENDILDENESFEYKLDMPDLSKPSFGFKKRSEIDLEEDIDIHEIEERHMTKRHYSKVADTMDDTSVEINHQKYTKKSKFELNIGAPDLNFASRRISSDDEDEVLSTDKDRQSFNKDYKIDVKESKDIKKSDQEIHIGLPDIHAPSLTIPKNSTKDGDYNIDIEDRKLDINISAAGPDVTLPSLTMKSEIKQPKGLEFEDRSYQDYKMGMPDIHSPSFKLKESSKLNSEFDDEGKATVKSKFGFNVSDSSRIDDKRKLDDDDSDTEDKNKKSKREFKLTMPDISMPSLNLKASSDEERDRSEQNSNLKTKSKHNYKLQESDINFPSLRMKSTLNDDDDNVSDDMEIGIKVIDGSKSDDEDIKKKSRPGFKLSMPDFTIPAFVSKGNAKTLQTFDDGDTISKSKDDINIKGIGITLPTVPVKGEAKSTVESDDSKTAESVTYEAEYCSKILRENDTEDSNSHITKSELLKAEVSIPTLSVGVKNKDHIDKELKDEKKKKSKHGFKIGMPDIPSFNLKPSIKAGKEFSIKDSDSKLSIDHNLKIQKSEEHYEINKTSDGLTLENKEILALHTAVTKPSLSLNSEYVSGIDVSGRGEEDNEHKALRKMLSDPESEKNKKDKKKSKEKSGFNFKFKGPEFSFPNFGNKNEKNSKELKHSGKLEASGMPIVPKFETDVKSEKLNSGINNRTNDDLKDLDIPEDANIPEGNLGVQLSIEDPTKSFSLNKTNEIKIELQHNEIDIDNECQEFKIPALQMERSEAHLNFSIPSVNFSHEKVSANEDSGNTYINKENSSLNSKLEMDPPFIISSSTLEGYEEAGTDYSLPDELKAEVTIRSEPLFTEADKLDISERSIDFSDIKIPNVKLSRGTPVVAVEPEEFNHNIGINVDSSEINSELSEDEMNDGLNATDASKKKRFGFKINAPDVSIPTFHEGSHAFQIKHEDANKNQSDEMKSFHMKLKSPSGDAHSFAEGISEDEHQNMYVQLPRVKISSSKAKKHADKDSADDKNISTPIVKLPKVALSSSLENECDEWKMQGGNPSVTTSNVSLLREKFNTKMKENETLSGTKYKLELDAKLSDMNTENGLNVNKLDFNIDEPDFLIPDLKSQPNYSSSFSPENFNIQNLKDIDNDILDSRDNTQDLPDYEINWKQIRYNNEERSRIHGSDHLQTDASYTAEAKEKSYLNSPLTGNVNTSLDSSSVETESDLPEADSDYKKAARGFALDVPIPKLSMTKMNLEKSFNKDSDISLIKSDYQRDSLQDKEINHFGNAFGFRGFKKHVDVNDEENTELNTDNDVEDTNIYRSLMYSEETKISQIPTELAIDTVAVAKDLPESDYDLNYKVKSYLESDIKEKSSVNYSIESKLKSLEESFNIKHQEKKLEAEVRMDNVNLETHVDNSKQTEVLNDQIKHSRDVQHKGKKDEDDDKSKSKLKIGKGFGFKGFSKSSDSEDNEVENKISRGPEGNTNENIDKSRSKTKKTFSFKGFGKSSSDTEEENVVKVSNNPMQRGGIEDKSKPTNKSSMNINLKSKAIKSSDSDDNLDTEKVDLNPQVESNLKKSKIKSNLGFGFMNKSKSLDSDNIAHADTQIDNKKENILDDEMKGKSKTKTKVLKETKSFGSESEGGDDEKLTMDARGEENRGKSKYGIGFGFRKSHGKNSSDSEGGGENYEQKVHLDERGSSDKIKEPKSKSLKLGFKGFKNLKGKIQTEINKMRHDSPSSDEDGNEREENQNINEKRKKVTKKKEKDKNSKRESEKYLDVAEESTLTSAANAAKENRRKRVDRKISTSSSSASSSSESSSDDAENSIEQKKKKKSKLKRREETKFSASNSIDLDINIPQSSKETITYDESISSLQKSAEQSTEDSHVTVIMSEPQNQKSEQITVPNIESQSMEMQSDPRNYVVVREMKLKDNISRINADENHEERTDIIKRPPKSLYLKKGASNMKEPENGEFWGSDSDMEKGKLSTMGDEVNLSNTSITLNNSSKQRVLTDSEELKRKAASLGDLSRLHERMLTDTLLERAVSLDLKNASVGPPSLHIRRLQLPDSSATSIDEVDESIAANAQKKMDMGGTLKSASQWGTLEEAMNLGNQNGNRHMNIDSSVSSPSIFSQTTVVKSTATDEGAPISNIEISGERGSSITALSAKKAKWDESFDDDDDIPSLPSSPIPMEKTTITVMEDDRTINERNEYSGLDPSIVVVGGEPVQAVNNFHNLNFHLHPSMISSSDTHIISSHGLISSSNTSINSDSGRYSPKHAIPGDNRDEPGGVTITMVPAESHRNAHTVSSEHLSLISTHPSRPLSSPPDLINYENMQQSSMVTVSHDLLQENGEIVTETTEHNISDEYVTPDTTPQKSMTQITLDGEGVSCYTVTDGAFSRRVIISNTDGASPVNIVQTGENELSFEQINPYRNG